MLLLLCTRSVRSGVLGSVSISTRLHSTVDIADTSDQHSVTWARAKPFQAIPGPKPYPLLGNIPRFLPGIGKYGKVDLLRGQMLMRKEYGDMVRLSKILGRPDTLFIFDPVVAEKVFRNEGVWPIRMGLETMAHYRDVLRKDRYEGARGVVTSQGEEWYDFRSKVNQPMMQPKSAARYVRFINDVAEDFIAKMTHLLDEKRELPADFINELYKWALESIAVVALDTRLGCLSPHLSPDSEPQRMIDAVQVIFEGFYELDLRPSLWRLVATPMWKRVVAAFDYCNEVSEKYVNKALLRNENTEDREPSILFKLMKKDPKVARVMATDMLIAGVDTTSHMSAALLFHLAKNQHVQQKAIEEISRALPSKRDPICSETLANLPYLKACLKESLRIFPVTIGNIRRMQEDIVLRDYQIPKGTDVFVGHMVMSRDEKYYPRPMSFEPERWLRGSAQAHTTHPFVSLPFGFGPRTCVGRRFAEMEILTLVAKILRNFHVEYHYGDEMEFIAKTINTITSPLKYRLIDHH